MKMKTILYGDDLESLCLAAKSAIDHCNKEGVPSGSAMGLILGNGKAFSIKWNKRSITVYEN